MAQSKLPAVEGLDVFRPAPEKGRKTLVNDVGSTEPTCASQATHALSMILHSSMYLRALMARGLSMES